MACVKPDGTLTELGEAVLAATLSPAAAEEVAARAGVPLYRARSVLRELAGQDLLVVDGESAEATAKGRETLERTRAASGG